VAATATTPGTSLAAAARLNTASMLLVLTMIVLLVMDKNILARIAAGKHFHPQRAAVIQRAPLHERPQRQADLYDRLLEGGHHFLGEEF
jgi:hypothetical protein